MTTSHVSYRRSFNYGNEIFCRSIGPLERSGIVTNKLNLDMPSRKQAFPSFENGTNTARNQCSLYMGASEVK